MYYQDYEAVREDAKINTTPTKTIIHNMAVKIQQKIENEIHKAMDYLDLTLEDIKKYGQIMIPPDDSRRIVKYKGDKILTIYDPLNTEVTQTEDGFKISTKSWVERNYLKEDNND